MAKTPTLMNPREAGRILERALRFPRTPITVADAAAQSGLALRDAERGLHWLTNRYRGHLRVTGEGALLYLFPHGFTRPWERRDAVTRALGTVARGAVGVGRFVIRAWLMVVLFAYVAIFLAVLVGMMFARQDDNSSSRRSPLSGGFGYVLFRVLADAVFWTFHPFSPLAMSRRYDDDDGWGARRGRRDETPFYEKVNRFVFGPAQPAEDPRAMERRILAQIRAQKGRIGLADVMRVTGLPREQADPLMARLMLDYDGDVEVSEDGGITYRFESLRKTTGNVPERAPGPVWAESVQLPALTGNGTGSNVLIAMLNGFNLLMSLVALGSGLTIANLTELYRGVPMPDLPPDGTPIALGLVPLFFSLAVFLLPLGRAALRPLQTRRAARENARRAVLREVLTRVEKKAPVTEDALQSAWKRAAGTAPASRELTRVVVDLGGDVEARDDGQVRYRFNALETEAAALEQQRANASDEEARAGRVVFASDQ